jgi:hypothetical protein
MRLIILDVLEVSGILYADHKLPFQDCMMVIYYGVDIPDTSHEFVGVAGFGSLVLRFGVWRGWGGRNGWFFLPALTGGETFYLRMVIMGGRWRGFEGPSEAVVGGRRSFL